MSLLFKQAKYGALLACIAWALSIAWASSASASPHSPDGDCKKACLPAVAAPLADHDADKGDKPDKAEKPEHPAKPEHPEHPAKPEHPEHPEHPAKPEKPAKHGKKGEQGTAAADIVVTSAPSNVLQQEALSQTLQPCTSRRMINIHLRHRRGVKFRSATVRLNGKRIATRHGRRITAPIDLRGLPKGTYRLSIRVVSTKGKVLRGTRTYHTCVGPKASRRTPAL